MTSEEEEEPLDSVAGSGSLHLHPHPLPHPLGPVHFPLVSWIPSAPSLSSRRQNCHRHRSCSPLQKKSRKMKYREEGGRRTEQCMMNYWSSWILIQLFRSSLLLCPTTLSLQPTYQLSLYLQISACECVCISLCISV